MRYVLLACLLIACGDDDGVDSGGVDSGGVDSGGVDSGGVDSGGVDSGGVDSGGVDSGGVDAAVDSSIGDPCPADPPTEGAGCVGARSCGWDRCPDEGLTFAQCSGSMWTVTTEDCGSLMCDNGETCEAGQICVNRVGGAFLVECSDNPCDSAPLTEECACEICAGNPCTVRGLTVECNTCPSGLCP